MDYIKIGSKQHKRATSGILLGSTITFAIMYSPQPLISLYAKQYSISPDTAGLSISLTTISLAVSLFFVSVFAGTFNRKKIMTWSLILTSCLTIASSFTHSFNAFLVLRFLEGISVAGFPSIAMAYQNEEFSPSDIGRVMGYYVSGTAIGGFTGRIIIGALTDLTNWHTAFLIQGVLSLAGSLWFLAYLPESKNFTRRKFSSEQWVSGIKSTLFNKRLFSIYVTGFLLMGAYITILDYIGYPLTKAPYNLSQTVFGFLFTVNLFGIWSSIFFGKLADKHSRRNILLLAVLILAAGVLLTLAGNLYVKIAGVSLVALGFMAGHSVASGWAGFMASRDNKGQASSFYLLFYYTGSSLLGWLGGIFLNYSGWKGLVFYVTVILAFAALVSFQPWKSTARERARLSSDSVRGRTV